MTLTSPRRLREPQTHSVNFLFPFPLHTPICALMQQIPICMPTIYQTQFLGTGDSAMSKAVMAVLLMELTLLVDETYRKVNENGMLSHR